MENVNPHIHYEGWKAKRLPELERKVRVTNEDCAVIWQNYFGIPAELTQNACKNLIFVRERTRRERKMANAVPFHRGELPGAADVKARAIAMYPERPLGRNATVFAHELGHLVLEEYLEEMGLSQDDATSYGKEAAAELFNTVFQLGGDQVALRDFYRTGYEEHDDRVAQWLEALDTMDPATILAEPHDRNPYLMNIASIDMIAHTYDLETAARLTTLLPIENPVTYGQFVEEVREITGMTPSEIARKTIDWIYSDDE